MADDIRVVDLAAGTGKFTRLLVPYFQAYYDCASESAEFVPPFVAVEPVKEMRDTFQSVVPSQVPIHFGIATNIPTPPFPSDSSSSSSSAESSDANSQENYYTAITVAQAFHWFATEDALKEIHRVLRPGGGLILIWNMEKRSDQPSPAFVNHDNLEDPSNNYGPINWVGRMRDLYEKYEGDAPQYRHGKWKQVFKQVCMKNFNDVREMYTNGISFFLFELKIV